MIVLVWCVYLMYILCMDKTQHIIEAIEAEQDLGLNSSEAEVLRYAVWRAWGDLGPDHVSSREFADAAEQLGYRRNTATNRYSEARRNWETMNA